VATSFLSVHELEKDTQSVAAVWPVSFDAQRNSDAGSAGVWRYGHRGHGYNSVKEIGGTSERTTGSPKYDVNCRKYLRTMQNHTTLRDVLKTLGPRALKVAPRQRGTSKTELEFIEAAAPEYLDRPALACSAPGGETLVLVQCTDHERWTIHGAFVRLPF